VIKLKTQIKKAGPNDVLQQIDSRSEKSVSRASSVKSYRSVSSMESDDGHGIVSQVFYRLLLELKGVTSFFSLVLPFTSKGDHLKPGSHSIPHSISHDSFDADGEISKGFSSSSSSLHLFYYSRNQLRT